MKKYITLFSLFLVQVSLLIFTGLQSGCSHPEPSQKDCEPWGQIRKGDYILTNNIWGVDENSRIKQCVASVDKSYEWTWDWKGRNGDVLAYPSVLYGHKPWSEQSTASDLPVKIANIKELNVAFKVRQEAKGSANLLLESWVTSSFIPKPSTRKVEIAIHLLQQNWPGMPRKLVDHISIDGHEYDVYVEPKMKVPGDKWSWLYLGFVHKGQGYVDGRIDMTTFINYAQTRGYIQTNHYLSSVELGSELVSGSGKTTVEKFSVGF